MNRSFLTAAMVSVLAGTALAGDFKEMKQAAPTPCPEWYANNEWNVSLWDAYLFTNTDYARNLDLVDVVQSTAEGAGVLDEYDRYRNGSDGHELHLLELQLENGAPRRMCAGFTSLLKPHARGAFS